MGDSLLYYNILHSHPFHERDLQEENFADTRKETEYHWTIRAPETDSCFHKAFCNHLAYSADTHDHHRTNSDFGMLLQRLSLLNDVHIRGCISLGF